MCSVRNLCKSRISETTGVGTPKSKPTREYLARINSSLNKTRHETGYVPMVNASAGTYMAILPGVAISV
jgi:hypothetical protein